jgi:Uma2 family endonuclease
VPLTLPAELRLTPEQFAQVCKANPEAVLELAADGELITMTPTGGETSARKGLLIARLQLWALARGDWRVFDSSGGFRLPDGSLYSPDAAAVRLERWQELTPEQRRGFPPRCPDLVIELVSASDAGPRGETALRHNMAAYMAHGAQLGWLLFPEQRAVEIWRAAPAASSTTPMAAPTPNHPERLEPADVLDGGNAFPGLRLELEEIWAV